MDRKFWQDFGLWRHWLSFQLLQFSRICLAKTPNEFFQMFSDFRQKTKMAIRRLRQTQGPNTWGNYKHDLDATDLFAQLGSFD